MSEESDDKRPDGIVCPYPTACVWWQTKRRQDRAIVGYSDGSVCFLCKWTVAKVYCDSIRSFLISLLFLSALTPNCPFIANTSLADSVVSFDICRDTSGQTVTLLVGAN